MSNYRDRLDLQAQFPEGYARCPKCADAENVVHMWICRLCRGTGLVTKATARKAAA